MREGTVREPRILEIRPLLRRKLLMTFLGDDDFRSRRNDPVLSNRRLRLIKLMFPEMSFCPREQVLSGVLVPTAFECENSVTKRTSEQDCRLHV